MSTTRVSSVLACAFTTALASTDAAAQTPACVAFNDTTTTATGAISAFGFGGQNYRAWQIQPAQFAVVQSAQFFTRNNTLSGDRFMQVEFWDDVGGLPGVRLAGGSWRIVNSRPQAWQGANLDTVVVLTPGTPVWCVWVDPGFSSLPEEPGGTTLPTASRTGNGVWTPVGAPTAPKVRLFCGLLDDANSVPVGNGCVQSNGATPSMFTNEPAQLGSSTFAFESSGSTPGAPVFLVFGLNGAFPPAPVPGLPNGCLQNTDVIASILLNAGTGTTRGPTCAGYVVQPFPLPADPTLAGFTIAAQAAPFDAGSTAPVPFATSNAQRVTLL